MGELVTRLTSTPEDPAAGGVLGSNPVAPGLCFSPADLSFNDPVDGYSCIKPHSQKLSNNRILIYVIFIIYRYIDRYRDL